MPKPLLALLALLAGAAGSLGLLTAREEPSPVWWSFRPLRPVAVPAGDGWCRTPIDAFVLAKMREQGLEPAPEADRRTLLRRLSFDLTGLPPTPEELAEFERIGYEQAVERLLASPAYGERWARHWLDTVHFAETHGHDQDRVRPNAWRYRDYLVNAFNSDTPYARFVQEQVAGDVLYPEEPRLIPALGFLAAGPWDESSLRDIREDSIDRKVGYYLDRDDMVMTTMTTFQSLSVQCARCHDHKLDPIAQSEHYALQAVFAGIGRGERLYDADPRIGRKRTELQARLGALDRNDPAILARLQTPEFRAELAAWEEKTNPGTNTWVTLDPAKVTSANGATLTRLPDASVRSEGMRPETDTVTAVVRSPKSAVTAVRLEVLTDPSLPHQGPGRQDNGNLHLSEFRVSAAKVEEGKVGAPRALVLRNPIADYDQPGWTIAHAIDGNPRTAWGIYPRVGQPHEGIFELAEPLGSGEWELTFTLDQLHGGGHLIGRFRLSVTGTSTPAAAVRLPGPIAAILRTKASERTENQWRDLSLYYLRQKTASELATLPPPLTVYAAGADFKTDGSHKPVATPRAVHVLKRGNIHQPQEEAKAGTVSCLPGLPSRFDLPANAPEGERRAALAKWLTREDNPLTWRSIVNRVWHYHFGKGIVDTPGEFGKLGSLPTHPELLDWLAIWFRDHGGSLKALHRLIVTSAVYRQSSRVTPTQREKDAGNSYLSHMPRTRLEAEQVRDAVLQASGRLDRNMGGPSDQQFAMRPGIHVTPIVEYGKFDWDRPQGHRRSVYRFVFRTLPDPFVECLDAPDASQPTPVRNVSVTGPQALALLNDEFILVHSKALAVRLEREVSDPRSQILRATELLWNRRPTPAEVDEFAVFASKHGLANLCRVLYNSNEFLFVD
jgi:hypothetical protein